MTINTKQFSSDIQAVRRPLEAWRRTRKHRDRIPEAQWAAMTDLARSYRVSAVSAALRVEYCALQERVRGSREAMSPSPPSPPTFIELKPINCSCSCGTATLWKSKRRRCGVASLPRLLKDGVLFWAYVPVFCLCSGPMDCVLRYRGNNIIAAEVQFIKELIAAHPRLSRRRLSTKLCQAGNWVQANGQLRTLVCRGFMLALHRAGLNELPPVRS